MSFISYKLEYNKVEVIQMIKRDMYMKQIRPYMEDPLIKVIMGMRRVGKSTLLQFIKEEIKEKGIESSQIIYMNFEIMKYKKYTTEDTLYAYLNSQIKENKKTYILLDELQEVNGFEKVINSIQVEYDVDIYITGSNSKLLSSELATYLTGRYITFEVFPLSFKEIMDANIESDPQIEFQNFVKYGGMPSIQRFCNPEMKLNYLSDLYSSILLKDIVKRYRIRDVDLLERFLSFVYHNIAQIFSATTLTKYLKNEGRTLSRETIYSYLKACENAYVIYRIPRFDILGKELLKTNEKYFMNDIGIRSLFFSNEKDIGQALENIVFLELKRRGYRIYVGQLSNGEVDFVIAKEAKVAYIQVCYLLASDETMEREFGALKKIKDNYPKYVFSLDSFDRSHEGIQHRNIIQFLLDEASLL